MTYMPISVGINVKIFLIRSGDVIVTYIAYINLSVFGIRTVEPLCIGLHYHSQ